MNDTTIQQLEWILPGLAAAAGLEHPDADASHLEPWAFPDPDQSMAHNDLERAKLVLAQERLRSSASPGPTPAERRIGAHAYLTREEFEALVTEKGFRRVAGAIVSRVECRRLALGVALYR